MGLYCTNGVRTAIDACYGRQLPALGLMYALRLDTGIRPCYAIQTQRKADDLGFLGTSADECILAVVLDCSNCQLFGLGFRES